MPNVSWSRVSSASLVALAVTLSCVQPASAASTPYGPAPAPIPGTIAAVDFDSGGEGVAYHDTTAGNNGGAYRSTDVDLEASAGGGYNGGWP